MRKLTRNNLDMMALELKQMTPAEQRRCVGGAGNCQHGVSTDDMCYECGGHEAVSWNEYETLINAGAWPGGWYMGLDGKPAYSPPYSGEDGITGSVTGFCKEHQSYMGQECPFIHIGYGEEYCDFHHIWYLEQYGCSGCVTGVVTGSVTESVSGYCGIHFQEFEIGTRCPTCADKDVEEESGTNRDCSLHGYYSGSSCPLCVAGDSSFSRPYHDVEYVVSFLADSSVNMVRRGLLHDAMNTIREDTVGDYIYRRLFSVDDPVRFQVGETQMRIVDGKEVYGLAQYQGGIITYHPTTEIGSTNLGEELVHALQHDVYGSDMTAKDLNYEFEAKLVNSIIGGDLVNRFAMGYDEKQGYDFGVFLGMIRSGDYTWEELKPEYQKHFSNWNDPNYKDQPGVSKPMDFDSQLIEEIIELYKK